MSTPLDASADQHDGARRTGTPKTKSKKVCRYYGTENGCRAGEDCPFLHVDRGSSATGPEQTADAGPVSQARTQRSAKPSRPAVTAVKRPVPNAQIDDPRGFQIGQLQRRFKPETVDTDGLTTLTFQMKPSDPDFPYEIESLACVLEIPATYPSTKASLQVTNQDIPRGFQINLERGFDSIVQSAPDATLLTYMNRLDKQLENILAGRKAETMTIISNRPSSQVLKSSSAQPPQPASNPSPAPAIPVRTYTSEERSTAAAKRSAHTRQLEARFGRLPTYAKSNDGRIYTLPLDSPKKASWPSSLQSLKSFDLVVPDEYPLNAPLILLDVATPEASAVERSFSRRCEQMQHLSLTQRINDLILNFASLASAPVPVKKDPVVEEPLVTIGQPALTAETIEQQVKPHQLDDRAHLLVIPRPPEWSIKAEEDDSGSDSYDSSSDDDVQEDEEPQAETSDQFPTATATNPERGVLLSFPHFEIHGIELLELTSLDITIKCERCKDTVDVNKLRNYDGTAAAMRQQTCKKCATGLAIGFRAEMMHVNSARAGYLDLEGCTVVDMLPSHFVPTCSECSTSYPAPGVVAVRGDSSMAICRECHHKMVLRIPEVKFLQVSAAAIRASRASGRKKKENLGITAGSELRKRGRCTHYAKSFRWFRFSCCSKVFPCDRCHDEQTDHPNEHANRMICGYCSREQNFRPEDCGICHAVLVGKRGHGFWEGGKGTRDPARMSKKDPRKYKRRPGTAPRS